MFLAIICVLHLEKHKIQKIKNHNINTEKKALLHNFNGMYIDKIKIFFDYIIVFNCNETIHCGIEEDLFMNFYMNFT